MTQPGDSTVDVPRAVALGWHIVELYQAPLPRRAGQPLPDRGRLEALVSWSRLSRYERACVYLAQVESDIAAMCPDQADGQHADHADGQRPDPGPVSQQLLSVRTHLDTACQSQRTELNQALQTLHVQLITRLTARNPQTGKAYRLGSAMGQTALLPDRLGLEQLPDMLDAYRLMTVAGWLRDLKSCLPDHASEAAQASLQAWRGWYVGTLGQKATLDPLDAERVRRALRAQGHIWRALLTGEKRAIDVLTPDDYVDAAGDLTGQVAQLVARFLRTRVGGLLLGLLLIIFIVSVILVLWGIADSVVASGVAVLGALGITAASIGAAVQQSVQPVQAALWQADLTDAVSRAATRLPVLGTQPQQQKQNRRTPRRLTDEELFAAPPTAAAEPDDEPSSPAALGQTSPGGSP